MKTACLTCGAGFTGPLDAPPVVLRLPLVPGPDRGCCPACIETYSTAAHRGESISGLMFDACGLLYGAFEIPARTCHPPFNGGAS